MEMEDIDTISRYYKIVFGYVFSLCGNRELTEDIVQDTFVKAILHEKCFRGDCKMESWLCQIAKNLYYSYLRKKKGQEPVEAHMAECEGCRQVLRAYTDETIVREVSRTEAHAEGKENEFHQILKNVENKVIKRVAVIAVIIVSFAAAIGIINFVPAFPASYEDAIVHVTASEEKDRIDIDTAQVRLHEDVVGDSIVLTGRYSLAARRSYEKSGQRYRYEKSLENRKISRVIYRGTDGTETVLWEK